MVIIEDFKGTWRAISDAFGGAGSAVFLDMPDLSAGVQWPGPTWRRFLAIASPAGAPVICCQRAHIDDVEIIHFQEEMFDRPRPPLGVMRLPVLRVRAWRSASSSTSSKNVTVSCSPSRWASWPGVLHTWSTETPSWAALIRTATQMRDGALASHADAYDHHAREEQALVDRAEGEVWAQRLAESPQFIAAATVAAMVSAACELRPALVKPTNARCGLVRSHFVRWLVQAARAVVEYEVKPRLSRQALEELEALAEEVAHDPEGPWRAPSPVCDREPDP